MRLLGSDVVPATPDDVGPERLPFPELLELLVVLVLPVLQLPKGN